MDDQTQPVPTPPADPAEVAPQAGPPEPRPSRRAAWIAMGSVAVALGLLWAASDLSQQPPPDEELSSAATAAPEDADETKVVGKMAPLEYTVKDMNGADEDRIVHLELRCVFLELLGLVVDREAEHDDVVLVLRL